MDSRNDPPSSNNAQTGLSFLNLTGRRDNASGETIATNRNRLDHAGVDSAPFAAAIQNDFHRGKSLVARDALPNISDA